MTNMKINVRVELTVPPNKRHLQIMRDSAEALTDNESSISILSDADGKLAVAESTMTKARQQDVCDRIMRRFAEDMPDYSTQSVSFPRSDAEERKARRASERARQRRAAERVDQNDPDYRCFLCGKRTKLVKTECCGRWICNDEEKYVLFSYARNSCRRNHRRFTLCAYHSDNKHKGDWKTCPKCREDFADTLEMYVWYGTNEYNWEKLPDPPAYGPTKCAKCGRVIRLANESYMHGKNGYVCAHCAPSPFS